jgi:hypothetical protein
VRCFNPVPRFSVVRQVTQFSLKIMLADFVNVNVDSHICGIVILKKVHWNYTGKKNHLLPEHPLYRQVQRQFSLEKRFIFSLFWQCFFGTEKMSTNLVAKFMPAGFLARRPERNKSDLTRLQVFPQGHDFLDDIVISVLIIERMRTSPSMLKDLPSSMLKDLF